MLGSSCDSTENQPRVQNIARLNIAEHFSPRPTPVPEVVRQIPAEESIQAVFVRFEVLPAQSAEILAQQPGKGGAAIEAWFCVLEPGKVHTQYI